jgi:hypothetical protein
MQPSFVMWQMENHMSNVIRFLESMGSKPLSPAEYIAGIRALDVDVTHKRALLDRDESALNELLDGRKKLRCAIFAADEE